MKLANQKDLIPVDIIPSPIAKIMLLMALSILAVWGLQGHAWAQPGGQCIVDQIEREPFNRRGLPKKAFTIILNDLDTGTGLWRAPYKVDTGGNTGWISAERSGYRAAYMFLVDQNTAEVLARVFFVRASRDAGYVQVNDKYMAEGQNTGIHFDGSCDYVSQAGSPFADQEYEPDNGPDVRPIILFEYQGEIVEDRSYTNTTGEAIEKGLLRFRDGGFIDEPFMTADGFGNESLVYQRQTVIAGYDAERNGNFLPAVVVYYDVLSPKVKIRQSDPTDPPPPPDENQPPEVSLTSPADGAVFTVGDPITLSAMASDDGDIAQVDFYQGKTLLFSDSDEPYTDVWDNAPEGSHSLTAVATDDQGLTATSDPITIMVGEAPQPPPQAGGQCIIDQIEREPFRRNGKPKKGFTIILNDLATGTGLWNAPYKVDTGGNTGWISAERTGYRAAYMFLVDQNTAEVLARVFFVRASRDAGYVQVNDRYMAEGQNTGIHFDGSCDYVSQAGSPFADQEYEPDNGPDVRPIILFEYQGEIVEDRSYTNTTGEAIEKGLLRFRDGGFTDEPFMTADGFGNLSPVYQRQTVIAGYDAERNGNFLPAVVVYYDVLSPKVRILQKAPQ